MAKHYIKHPIKPTEWGVRILRTRMSLKETQREFAARFMVVTSTINNWETGKTQFVQRIHRQVLETMISRLQREGNWMPEPMFTSILRQNIESAGNGLL